MKTVDLSKNYKQSIAVRKRRLAGKAILIKLGEAYELDEVSEFIWDLLDGKRSGKEIIDQITTTYEVNYDQSKIDFEDLLNLFLENDLIDEN